MPVELFPCRISWGRGKGTKLGEGGKWKPPFRWLLIRGKGSKLGEGERD
jgi:hypothetical protein